LLRSPPGRAIPIGPQVRRPIAAASAAHSKLQIPRPSARRFALAPSARIGIAVPIQEKTMITTTKTERIRELNDRLRQDFSQGRAVMTAGVAALDPNAVVRIVKSIAVYDGFCQANDPHEEHDFGSFEVDGHTIFFKIDYYDKTLECLSPDPADPAVTERVITIMLAEEY
jgi:Protein of unknown function (DUF3768)